MDVIMRNELANVQLVSLTKNEPMACEMTHRDDQVVFVIANSGSNAVNVTVKAGNGLQGVNDETYSVAPGLNLIKLESGRFKNVSGENKDKVVVVAAGDNISVGAVALI